VRELATGREYDESYDRLVLATGATPIKPPLPGINHPRVQTLRNVPDMDRVKALVDAGARHAVVVGGGYIGVEVAEAFAHRGVGVTLVELADQVMGPLDPEMAAEVADEMRAHGVEVRTGTGAKAFRPDPADTPAGTPGPVTVELSDGTEVVADVVLLAIGVVPDTRLHKAAGLELTPRGAVVVDAHMRTSDPDVYAAGDSVQVLDTVTGLPGVVPLAGPANRQGRIAADHIAGKRGRSARYTTSQGSGVAKVFAMTVALTGASEASLKAAEAQLQKNEIEAEGPEVEFARRAYDRAQSLFEQQLVAQSALDDAKSAYDVAANRQRSAKGQLVVSRARVIEARAKVAQQGAAVARVQEDLRNATLRAPIRGMVLSRDVEIGSPVSSILNLGANATLVMTVGDIDHVFVRGKVDEADIGRVRLGQPARISVETFKDKKFEGKVTQISPIGVEKENVTTFEVEVSIDNPGNELKANMTANAEIILEEHPRSLIIPEAAISYDPQRNAFVEVPAPGEKTGRRKVPVKLGIGNGTKTQVLQGLKAGDKVVLPS
jgi:HlyD family secretion protein